MISVIIPCYASEQTLGECLDALARQTFPDFEVILVDSSPDPTPSERIAARYSSFRYVHVDERLLPHAGRNRGAALARGSIFAFTDPDCRAEPDWLACIAAAHRDGADAVGGSVGAIPGWRNTAIHMVKYGWWLPGGRPATLPQLPSANLSVTRSLWDRIGPFAEERWAGDTEFSWRIAAAGVPLRFEPDVRITHLDHGSFGAFVRERWARGRDYGLMRAEAERWGRLHCIVRILASPLVPLVMLWRSAGRAAAARRATAWLLTAPVQFVAQASWALGEAAGHWRRARLGAPAD